MMRRMFRPVKMILVATVTAALVAGLTLGMPVMAHAEPGTETQQAASVENQAVQPGDATRATALQAAADETGGEFYQPPGSLPDGPGQIVRSEPMEFYLDPVKLIEVDAAATRVMYTTTNSAGERIASTGTVLVSNKPWRGDGPRPLIGYAPGTQGLGDDCAPSKSLALGQQYEGPVMTTLLEQGYALAVPDYEGLGTPGLHTYMDRVATGNATLDAMRAAQNLGAEGIDAENPVALVGYSQGGGATAAASELAGEYAPELDIVGASMGAPPADLMELESLDGGNYIGFMLFALAGQNAAFDLGVEDDLNESGRRAMEQVADMCTTEAIAAFAGTHSSSWTKTGETLAELMQRDGYREAIEAQRLGTQAPDFPVFVQQGLTDDVIPFHVGRGLAEDYCDRGGTVLFHTLLTPTHIGGYIEAAPHISTFTAARLRGDQPLNSCWRL